MGTKLEPVGSAFQLALVPLNIVTGRTLKVERNPFRKDVRLPKHSNSEARLPARLFADQKLNVQIPRNV